jgi:PAS domain S-box-containing protein
MKDKEKRVILVVEDDTASLSVLFDCLKIEGFKVLIAATGADAVKSAERSKPDIILLDIGLPDMDGFEVHQRLRKCTNASDVPIIFLTALTDTKDVIRGLSLDAVDYITKPFQAEQVIARIKRHLSIQDMQKNLELTNLKLHEEISKRVQTETALRESESRYKAIVSAIPDMILRVTREGVYTDCNVPSDGMFPISREKFIGKNIREMEFPPEFVKKALSFVRNTLDTKKIQIFEYQLKISGTDHEHEARLVPFTDDEVLVIVRNVTETRQMRRQLDENEELKEYLKSVRGFQNIITRSPQMLTIIRRAAKVAEIPGATVTIYGESGTGKELLARAVHSASGAMESRFLGINCAAIPSGLLESELFGHVKGAFTGADRERQGKIDLAQNGTLLLDEIGDMPQELQAKLLRVLQERTYEKVGSNEKIETTARIITTTHRNLLHLVREGNFREDLFHRINAFPITLPPLRERADDIPLLTDYFIKRFRSETGKSVPGISEAAMEALLKYRWPGNIRELKNCIERAVILNENELIKPFHLMLLKNEGEIAEDKDNISFNMTFETEQFSLDAITDYILQYALKKYDHNKTKAADFLKVDRKIFYRRLRK